jgi:hypothetical protein
LDGIPPDNTKDTIEDIGSDQSLFEIFPRYPVGLFKDSKDVFGNQEVDQTTSAPSRVEIIGAQDFALLNCRSNIANLFYPHQYFNSMDRGDGIIRWSRITSSKQFLSINVGYPLIQLYQANGHAVPEKFDYAPISRHTEFPGLTAYDWSPKIGGLLAIGTKSGEVQLLRIDDGSNASVSLPLKLQRACQAVAFNTTGLLAVCLDRVRNDQCLQIWDVDQRLSHWDPSKPGWQKSPPTAEPVYKLEPSVSVTSVRFFEDQPQTLVVGVKNQSVRVHDLRGSYSLQVFDVAILTIM